MLEIWNRILERVEFEPNSGCWLWSGAVNNGGYGKISSRKKYFQTHRVSCEVAHGDIPEGHYACHRCDTPACVNPDHLFAALPTGNYADMRSKGRVRIADHRGEANPKAKISCVMATDIKRRLRAGERIVQIARALGLTVSLVGDIKLGRSWRDAPI